jgi:hypothetical protein
LSYSLFLPSSVFGLVHEESGAGWWCVKVLTSGNLKIDCARAGRRGDGRDNFSPKHAEIRLTGLRTNLWDGCFRAAVLQAAPSGSTTDVPVA